MEKNLAQKYDHKAVEEGNTTDGLKKDISLQVINRKILLQL